MPGTPAAALNPSGVAIRVEGPATSFSTPFVAGIAALTWAANTALSAGQVEGCLSSTSTVDPQGGNHRVVNASAAVSCALGNPAQFAPAIMITSPTSGTATSLGLNTARAVAVDVEDGTLNAIGWAVNGVAQGGTSTSGGSFLYDLTVPGAITLRATVADSMGASASATALLSIPPAPPILRIVNPERDGHQFPFGLPVIFQVQQLDAGLSPPACSSFQWAGWDSTNAPMFSNRPGCLIEVAALGLGTSKVTASLTKFGLTGTDTRTATVVDDGKLHVSINSPTRPDQLGTDSNPLWGLDVLPGTTAVAFGSLVVPALRNVATYQWTVGPRGALHTAIPGATLPGLLWTRNVNVPNCGHTDIVIGLLVTDVDANPAYDEMTIRLEATCSPP
jgi:hypothetical protein